ncbi:MAG: DUF7793 family protein [Bacteroidia bacterium]
MEKENGCAVHVPTDRKVTETATSNFWFDDGILYSTSKGHNATIEDVHDNIAVMKKLVGSNKVCFIADTSETRYYTIEMRDVLTRALPELFKAIALVPCKPMGKIMGSMLFMRRKHFPVQIFEKLEDAKEWIKQYQQK